MLKFSIKNLNIEKKILVVTTLLLVLTQVIIGVLSYVSITKMADYSLNEADKLSVESMDIGESSLKNQSEEYLKSLSYSSTKLSDALFKEISNQLDAFCKGTENLYQDKNILKGEILPLPELCSTCDPKNRNTANAKAFAIDTSSLKSDSLSVLAYNIPECYTKYTDNFYFTNTNSWNSLTEDQKNYILSNYSVVSQSTPPTSIKNELMLLSNLKYISEPLFKSNDSISSIYIGTESGILYRYSCDNSNRKYDPRTRPWYTSAIQAKDSGENSPVWQSTYIAQSTGKLCITCSKAFLNSNGEILGVAAIDMYLDDITQYVTDMKLGQTGYSFIIDNQGNIVIHPEYSTSIATTESSEKKTLILPDNFIKEILSTKTGTSNAQINGEDYYFAYNPLSTTNWIFITLIENDEIIEPINHIENLIKNSANTTASTIKKDLVSILTQFLIIFCLCALITYWVGVKLSKSLSNPIMELSKKTEKIGNGNFSLRIPVESKDEIGQLAYSFNKMTENLEKYVKDLAKATAEKEKIHSELRIAKKIQRSMLPCIFPAFPHRQDLDIYAIMDPAREVGGDFYDFFFIDKNNLAMVIADVSDKGISAALFMVIAKILIKNELQNGSSPVEVFEIVNKRLCENNDAGMFVTCFIGIINIETGKFTYGNAGHNPPIIYKYLEKKCVLISKPRGFVLGAMPKMHYSQNETYLNSKDFLIFYTDGVTEAVNRQGKLFSEEKLKKIILDAGNKNLKMEELILKIRTEIETFANGAHRSDDITIMGLQGLNINPPSQNNHSIEN